VKKTTKKGSSKMPETSHPPSSDRQPESENIEMLLRSFRPSPSIKVQRWAANEGWKNQPAAHQPRIGQLLGTRGFRLSMAAAALLILLGLALQTTWGKAYADSLFQFFRVASSTLRSEIVSQTPMPTYEPFSLTIAQAQQQAGFVLFLPERLPTGFTFQGANVGSDPRQVEIMYSASSPSALLNVTEQMSEFDRSWETCPTGTITPVDINGRSGELANGIAWITEQEPTPGAERQWTCIAGDEAFELRWQAGELRITIDLTQLGGEGSARITPDQLVDVARSMK
jgi:hypothetical protein